MSTQSPDLKLNINPLRDLNQQKNSNDRYAERFRREVVENCFEHRCVRLMPSENFKLRWQVDRIGTP